MCVELKYSIYLCHQDTLHIESVCGVGASVGLLQLIPHFQPALGIVQHLLFVMQFKFQSLIGKLRLKLLQTVEKSSQYRGSPSEEEPLIPVMGGTAQLPTPRYSQEPGQTYISTVSYQRPLFWQMLMFAWSEHFLMNSLGSVHSVNALCTFQQKHKLKPFDVCLGNMGLWEAQTTSHKTTQTHAGFRRTNALCGTCRNAPLKEKDLRNKVKVQLLVYKNITTTNCPQRD